MSLSSFTICSRGFYNIIPATWVGIASILDPQSFTKLYLLVLDRGNPDCYRPCLYLALTRFSDCDYVIYCFWVRSFVYFTLLLLSNMPSLKLYQCNVRRALHLWFSPLVSKPFSYIMWGAIYISINFSRKAGATESATHPGSYLPRQNSFKFFALLILRSIFQLVFHLHCTQSTMHCSLISLAPPVMDSELIIALLVYSHIQLHLGDYLST